MRVRFTTDGSVTNSGWSASWSCTSPPPPTCDSYYGPDTYVKGQLAIFRWARQHWVISDLGPGMNDFSEDRWLYKVASSADTPPSTGWTVDARGTSPAPNVASGAGGALPSCSDICSSNSCGTGCPICGGGGGTPGNGCHGCEASVQCDSGSPRQDPEELADTSQ